MATLKVWTVARGMDQKLWRNFAQSCKSIMMTWEGVLALPSWWWHIHTATFFFGCLNQFFFVILPRVVRDSQTAAGGRIHPFWATLPWPKSMTGHPTWMCARAACMHVKRLAKARLGIGYRKDTLNAALAKGKSLERRTLLYKAPRTQHQQPKVLPFSWWMSFSNIWLRKIYPSNSFTTSLRLPIWEMR